MVNRQTVEHRPAGRVDADIDRTIAEGFNVAHKLSSRDAPASDLVVDQNLNR